MHFIDTVHIQPQQTAAAVAKALREALGRAKVVHLRGLAQLKPQTEWAAFYDEVTEATGRCLSLDEDYMQGSVRTGHKWIEVRYDAAIPDDAAYRFSKNAQPLHTDESYLSDPADVMFMHCLVQAPAGGETTFVAADALLSRLRAQQPELCRQLLNRPMRFSKADDARTQPIIAQTPAGLRLNWNFHCLAPDETAENQALALAFRNYLLSAVEGTDIEAAILLGPGEAVAWWDEQVLHGRRAFQAHATNDRFLLKSGFKLSPSA